MSSKKNIFVPRVNQLDAIHLDHEINRLIRDGMLENLQEISPILFTKIQPEIDLIIQSALWFGSVGKQFSTFGQQILRITYDTDKLTKSRLCLHFLLTIIPKYLHNTSEHRIINQEWLHSFISYANNTALILSILNFFRFLKTGRKPSLIDFLLGLDYTTLDVGQKRNLGYDYMTRELVWGGFMELFGMILPLINYHKLKRYWKSNFGLIKKMGTKEAIIPKLDLNTICAFCEERPTLPHHIGCGHIFCYYCVEANILTDPNFSCPICEVEVVKIQPINEILDDTKEMMPRITSESVDPALQSCAPLSYHRYTSSALLLLKDVPLSHDVPDCIHDKRLKSLRLWKSTLSNYLNKNTEDGDVMDNGNSTGGITNCISSGNERRQIGNNNDWNRNNSERIAISQKSYIDPRSISSSHLMPKFIKRGIIENSQHQSSSSTSSSSSINISDSTNINNYGRNNYHQLSYGNNDTGDSSVERYNRKEQLENRRSNTVTAGTNDNNKLTTDGNNRIVTVSASSPSNSNINSRYNHHYNSITNSTSSDNKNDQQQHQQQNSSTTNLRGGERRIGSGRIPFSTDDWKYRNNDKDNSNNITNLNNDYDGAANIGSNISNNNNYNNTRYDNRNLSSQHQQSEYRNDRHSYGRNNDYDNHRNNLDKNSTIQQQYHQTKRLISSDINNQNNSSINYNNNGINNIINDRHHNNIQPFNHSKTIQQHRTNNRHRSNNYSSRNNDEPEWFSCGPTSQHDTIELRGFDESDDVINLGNNRNRKNRNDNLLLNTTNNKVHQEKQKQQNNNNRKVIDVESVCNNVPPSPPSARSTPTKKLLNNKVNNDDNSGDNTDDDKKSAVNKDEKIQKEFNIDEFLSMDPFNNCFGGEQKTYNIDSGGGNSRFKHWFKTGENDKNDDDNGLQETKSNNIKRSSLHEDLNNTDKGDSTQQQKDDNGEKNILHKFIPIGIQQHHNSQQSLLEFFQRGNFNNSTNNIGQQLNSPNLSNIGGSASNIQRDRIFQKQQEEQNFNSGKGGINHYTNIDNKQKGLIPSVKELEARMRKDNNELCIVQNTLQQQQLPSKQTNNNNAIVQLNAQQLPTVNQISTPSTASIVADNNIQNNQPKQDMEAFKRLLEKITTNNNNNGVDNLSDCSSSSSTAVNLLNDTTQLRQQENINHLRQEELKHLIYQQHNNFGRQHQQHQIIRENEMLLKCAQVNMSSESLNEIIKRPEARALLIGVASGELTQSSLVQLANNGAGGGRYSEVILPILNLLSMPSPLSYINGNNHHGQQQNLSPIPGGFNSTIQHGSANGSGVLGQYQSTTGMPQNIPSARELQAHTQSIMQTALIRKKLEEEQDNYRGHQDIQLKNLQQQHFTNIQQKHILNPIEISIGNIRNSPTPMINVGDKSAATISASQQQQIRSATPTSTIAFTPTSVLRKMTAKKDNNFSPDSDNTNSSGSNNNNNYQYVNKIMQNLFMQNSGSGNIPFQQNNTSTNQTASTSGQPRMILGGGSQHQQQHLQHNTAPVLNAVGNNQIVVNKPMGRPILKGSTGLQTTLEPPQMSFASQIEFQQLQQQRNKIVSNPQHHHLPSSTQQQTTGENVLINGMQQQQHLQQIFQQQRQSAIRTQQQFNPHILPGNVASAGLINPVPANDNSNNAASTKIVKETNAQQLNTQREGGLSPTSNQLARWFTPELLAQASAGKLPALNMGQALSLEEFEKSIQHSSAAVHN